MTRDLGIHLESTKVVAGSVIKGCVYVDVKGSTRVDEISLRLVGEESTKVQYTVEVDVPGTSGDDSPPQKERQTRYEYGKRNLINLQLPIDNSSLRQDGIIPIGRYELPFEVELPDVLLPSIYETSNEGYCKVAYKLHVELRKAGRIFSSTLKAEQDIEIRAKPLNDEIIPYNAPPVTESVSFCCCINKGQMHFGAKVKDTRLDRGETTTISMSCRNESTASIDTIQATLHQKLKWKAGTYSEIKSTVLAHITFDTFQDEQEFASSNASDPEQATRDIIFREVESGVHSGKVAMPMTANLSMNGSLMSCVHYIIVQVNTGTCVDNPSIRIPIQCGEPRDGPPLQKAPTAAVPSDFHQGATVLGSVHANTSMAVMGGKPQMTNHAQSLSSEEPDLVIEPFSSDPDTKKEVSLKRLIQEMEDSIQDLSIVQCFLRDPAWDSIFKTLTPTNYGNMISHVDTDFNQPKVAYAVAEKISNFSCAHVVRASKACDEWNVAATVEKLILFCKDLAENQDSIKNELSSWDQMVTAQAFENALKGGN
jgi:hypothetical protein